MTIQSIHIQYKKSMQYRLYLKLSKGKDSTRSPRKWSYFKSGPWKKIKVDVVVALNDITEGLDINTDR